MMQPTDFWLLLAICNQPYATRLHHRVYSVQAMLDSLLNTNSI